MIPNVGILEIAIVLVIALIVFGPKRLPELGKSLGRGLSEFRDGVSSIGDSLGGDDEDDEDDEDDDDGPIELTAPPEAPSPEADPEVIEVTEVPSSETQPETELVDGEVVTDRRD
jgi:sec-independent protein translocase protein TatA